MREKKVKTCFMSLCRLKVWNRRQSPTSGSASALNLRSIDSPVVAPSVPAAQRESGRMDTKRKMKKDVMRTASDSVRISLLRNISVGEMEKNARVT
jgi:hypothetical protein